MSESQSSSEELADPGDEYVPEQRPVGRGGRGRGRGRPRGRGRGRGSVRGTGHPQVEDPLNEDDHSRVQVLQANRIATEQARIQSLSLQQCQDLLGRCLSRDPSLIFDVLAAAPPSGPPGQGPTQPEWCVCMKCREMPTDVERKYCGQPPQQCISLLPHVDIYILNEGVLRLARRIWNDIRARQDPPNPGEDNKQFRYAAYRQFVVWQYGALGQANRIVIPSCCVWKIRDKYPDPHNNYVGFIPRRL